MKSTTGLQNAWVFIRSLLAYNLKIVFAGKFIYFLLAAMAIFFLVSLLNLLNPDASLNEADLYYLLLVPGLLIIFYPITFGIQNDLDTRMIEILFGIANYRYKVWLIRLLMIFLMTLVFLLLLGGLSRLAWSPFPLIRMITELMFPLLFLGCLAFMFSTLTRNGYGTAAIMIFLGLMMWISSEPLAESKWNIFLNPFRIPRRISELAWERNISQNRLYMMVGSVITLLTGLLQLQKREKFMR